MARSRNIKPAFFKNLQLAECQPLARLLYQGLWCLSDREGRLRDQPRLIKAECLPYDNCDVDELLNELVGCGLIIRYVASGQKCILIPTFKKHQNPHIKEVASELPEYIDVAESTVQAPDQNRTSTEQALLIPDSLLLIPDSRNLIPEGEPSAKIGKYAFEGEVIRITHEQQARWQSTFSSINVIEHLKGIDATYAKEKAGGRDTSYWFPRCAQALARSNAEALKRKGGYDV